MEKALTMAEIIEIIKVDSRRDQLFPYFQK